MPGPKRTSVTGKCPRTIPTNVITFVFTENESIPDVQYDRFIYDVANTTGFAISRVNCGFCDCVVEYALPPGGDDFAPLKQMMSAYAHEPFIADFVKAASRPMTAKPDVRIESSYQELWYHPSIYKRCVRGLVGLG